MAVEVNSQCNISCDGCYKAKDGKERPIGAIKKDIDEMMKLRALHSITIMGGEPALHGDLDEIIRYIASKGIRPILLTNGTLATPERLRRYKEAGLRRIIFHVDSHQDGRPDTGTDMRSEKDLNALRRTHAAMCGDAGLDAGVALTLYKDAFPELKALLDFVFGDPRMSVALFTCYSQAMDAEMNKGNHDLQVYNGEVYAFMEETERAYPVWYIPRTHDEKSLGVLFYFLAVTVGRDRRIDKYYFHPRKNRLVALFLPKISRLIRGRHVFDQDYSTMEKILTLALAALFSLSITSMVSIGKLLVRSAINRNLKPVMLIFEEAPVHVGDGLYSACEYCPDVTLRNGKMVPICIADKIDPDQYDQFKYLNS